MCVKLPQRELNHDPCLPHSTNTYTCEMTIMPRMRGSNIAQY